MADAAYLPLMLLVIPRCSWLVTFFVPSAFGFLKFSSELLFHPWRTSVTQLQRAWDGLWPSNRWTHSTLVPDASTIDASPNPTSTPSASLEPMSTSSDLAAAAPMDTYSAPPQPAVPFPTHDPPHFSAHRHAHFTARVVHQIHFKIFTHSNNERELFIEEIPTSGISKCRDPEHFFYGLSGNWEWSLQTADYWRHHFEIPLLHGNNPFRNVAIETTPSPDEAGHVTTIPALARQLSDSLTAATASGELSDPWGMVAHMSFHDAIQVLQQASSSTSE